VSTRHKPIRLFSGIFLVLVLAWMGVSIPANAGTAQYVGGVNVGYPQNGRHWWGKCLVQDFKGGPHGWAIVSYTGGTHIVRGGLLFGWFDQKGAPGSLGCPIENEHTIAGATGFQVQHFQHGILYWNPGMDHAKLVSATVERAVEWAVGCTRGGCTYHSGSTVAANYYMWCLAFVYDAYAVRSNKTPQGPHTSAIDWWKRAPGVRHQDSNPPRGVFVFWNKSGYNPDGHVALSLGNGWLVTTGAFGKRSLRVDRLQNYATKSYGYLGWMTP